jgi:endonuclease YncB( thermonuclease family)
VFVWLVAFGVAHAAEYRGTASHVQDGDSFVLSLASGGKSTIRLAECDAPEQGQPFGEAARRHLRQLIEGKVLVVLANENDAYGRLVGRVYLGKDDINAAMVEAGFAWANEPYLTDRDFIALERAARAARKGLWNASVPPQAPWLWRQDARETRQRASVPEVVGECRIKGNISASGRKIYHLPGSHSWADTRINARQGERWFCTEEEAVAAGWQAARG